MVRRVNIIERSMYSLLLNILKFKLKIKSVARLLPTDWQMAVRRDNVISITLRQF